jgi:hypothetical protein
LVLCACADVRARPPLDDDDGGGSLQGRVEVFACGCAKSEAGGTPLTIPDVTARRGSTIAVSVLLNRGQTNFHPTITWNGLTASASAAATTTPDYPGVRALWLFKNISLSGTADVVLAFDTSVPPVQIACASEILGLTENPDALSLLNQASGNDDTPTLNATSIYTRRVYWVLLATMGPHTDAVGTWTTSAGTIGTGQRLGTTTLAADSNRTLSEAYQIATSNRTISKPGITAVPWYIAQQPLESKWAQ